MMCPTCGLSYEPIYTMGQVAPVASIPRCTCSGTGNTSVPGSYLWTAPSKFSSISAPIIPMPTPPSAPTPQEPLQPAEEIVADMLDLLDELDDD